MAKYDSNKKQIESLIKCGAFDSMGVFRSRLLAVYEEMLDAELDVKRKNISGQMDMFDIADAVSVKTQDYSYPDIPEFSLKDRLNFEKEASGLYFSGHLLDNFSKNIEHIKPDEISDIISSFENDSGKYTEKQRVALCGIIRRRVNKNTKKGDLMAFVTLEDRFSEIEAVIFPKVLNSSSAFLLPDTAVVIHGEVTFDEEGAKILASSVLKLRDNAEYKPEPKVDKKTMYVKLPDFEGEIYRRAVSLVSIYEADGAEYEVVIYSEKDKKYSRANIRIIPTKLLVDRLEKLIGQGNVIFK